jgi:N-acetylglucosamine-6-phosphate deacetylase
VVPPSEAPLDLHIDTGVIVEKPVGGARRIDADGLLVAPGYVDLQINGGFGFDFTADPATIWQVGARLPELGVTTFLPTVISAPAEVPAAALDVLRGGAPDGYRGALPVGLHIEGPMISPDNCGTHPRRHLVPPSLERVEGWTREAGVAMVTLAPELPGALEVIARLAADGVVVSAGHSTATLQEAQAGFAAGITHGTHLLNAMPPLNHRSPGLAGALLASEQATAGVILDGIHVAPEMVRIVWNAMGPNRMIPVTDAMAGMGMPPGDYALGDLLVTVTDVDARNQEGGLAGSNLRMDQAVRNLVAFTGCSMEGAATAASLSPRRVLRLPPAGRGPGERADVVLLTEELDVVASVVAGEVAYGAGPG